MNIDQLIKQLKASNLYAECQCGAEFKLSRAILFDGLGKFPATAEEKTLELLQELKDKTDALKKRKVYADIGAEKKAIEVGFGKIIEKIIPSHKEFKIPTCDCRPLFEPIDMIVFNGATRGSVDSIDFLEIKTGKSQLNRHQRMIRDAVDDRDVSFKVV